VPFDNLARAVDRILNAPRHIRLGPRGNGIPADLEPLESRREQQIVRSMAVPLDGRRDRADLGPELLELTLVCELSLALARENLVDALVFAAADLPDEIAKLRSVFDPVGGELTDFRGTALEYQPRNRLSVAAVDRGLECLFFSGGEQSVIRHALLRRHGVGFLGGLFRG